MAKPPGQTLINSEHDGFRELKARFDEAHAEGMAALQRKDFQALETAIRRERDILNEQHLLILFRLHRQSSPKSGRR